MLSIIIWIIYPLTALKSIHRIKGRWGLFRASTAHWACLLTEIIMEGSVAEKGRVGDWRGSGRWMGVAVPGGFRGAGSRMRSCFRPRKPRRSQSEARQIVLLPQPPVRETPVVPEPHRVLTTEPSAQPPGSVPIRLVCRLNPLSIILGTNLTITPNGNTFP